MMEVLTILLVGLGIGSGIGLLIGKYATENSMLRKQLEGKK